MDKLLVLRQQYVESQKKYQSLSEHKRELDKVSHHMNRVMFNISVAKQSFDGETLESYTLLIQEQMKELDNFMQRADCK